MPLISFQVISGKEYPIDACEALPEGSPQGNADRARERASCDVGAHRDAPLQVPDKSDQNLVKIFREITSVFK